MTPYYDEGGVKIYHGDVLDVLRQLPDGIVQTCVTSPPYWGLRCYGTDGQLGLESTPEEFIAKMVEVFREVRRVLRDDGTAWVNLGDSYASQGGERTAGSHDGGTGRGDAPGPRIAAPNLKPKDLCGIPWRVALALQADGWYLRSDIIWSKPNPMPESCTDRPTKAHEYVFLLSKSARYYYDADAVREPHTEPWRGQGEHESSTPHSGRLDDSDGQQAAFTVGVRQYNPAGRNKRTVWTVATESFKGAHFATYPRKLIEPCILAGATDRACAECGKPWRRVVERESAPPEVFTKTSKPPEAAQLQPPGGQGQAFGCGQKLQDWRNAHPPTTIGHEPDCKCGTTETRPSIVLDPFMGSGTTAEVARKHGCHVLGIELNAEYIELARKRLAQGVLDFP